MGLIDGLISPISSSETASSGVGGSVAWGDITSKPTTLVGFGITDPVALTTNPLSQFAATTSAQLRGVLSDETGTGLAVFNTSPTFVTPILGTPTSGTLTNCTGLPQSGVVNLTTDLAGKQSTLVSGTNIKTVNGNSLLGSGDVVIAADIDADPLVALLKAVGSTTKGKTPNYQGSIISVVNDAVSGTASFTLFPLTKETTITGGKIFISVNGAFTANNFNGIAIYSINGTNLIKEAESANDGNIFKTGNNSVSSVPFVSPVVLPPGVYAIGVLYSASANTTVPRFHQISFGNVDQPAMYTENYQLALCTSLAGQTSFSSTIAIGSLSVAVRSPYAHFY